tara:strand:- start:240 stop:785 length:546 start_codon:yes stop_codon:yes gene_type:complete
MTMAVAGLVLAGVSAYAQIKQGEATKKAMYNQAEHKRLEGRVESVKAKQQGIQVLKATNQALASVNAIAYSGGLEPNIGTPQDIGTFGILNPGMNDFLTSKDNEFLAISSANAQAEDLRFAGRQAKKQGYIGALTTMGSAMMSYNSVGSAPSGGTGTTSYTGSTYAPNTTPRVTYGSGRYG